MTEDPGQLELLAIIPPRLAITAMRDSGYKNTAYALAELVDNAAQAKADLIEVFSCEVWQEVNSRERRRISALAVLDNGCGMTALTLRRALQFGNGERLSDRSGMGRFGMGLPNSSVSQAGRVEVWTWQNGVTNALYSYLDVEEIEAGMQAVPTPELREVPAMYLGRSGGVGPTGTLVVWSKLDQRRLTWKTGKATLTHVARLGGRMYRKLIHGRSMNLRLVAFDDRGAQTFEDFAAPNDPLYLTSPSITPPPFDNTPMFQRWGEADQTFQIPAHNDTHTVTVRISWARSDTVPEDRSDRGRKPYGRHAAGNVGVSIMRADRELDLDQGWAISYDPTERWWGVEVDFPPALDEIFGVTNNKQAATVFSQMVDFDWTQEQEEDESFLAYKERLRDEGDPKVHLIDIADYIRTQLAEVRKKLAAQTKGLRTPRDRHDSLQPDDRASDKFKMRAKEGYTTDSDKESWDSEAERALVKDLEGKDYSKDAAEQIAKAVSTRDRRTIFVESHSDSLAFFEVEQRPGGLTEIVFNTSHQAYSALMKALDDGVENASNGDLVERIQNASDTLRLLFAAWARYEIEDLPNRQRIRLSRHEWGKMAEVFLDES